MADANNIDQQILLGTRESQPLGVGGSRRLRSLGRLAVWDLTLLRSRGFDVETGKELWKAQLPASANATPMTYSLGANGKQYLVIAAGGHPKITEEPLGDALVAFILP